MDFFSFLETQASAELQHRRDIDLAETKSAEVVGSGAGAYVEGQLSRMGMGGLPSWVVPVAAVAIVFVVWKAVK